MMSSMWTYITLLVGSSIAAVVGWIKTYMLTKKLRQSNASNIILDIERMKAEAELREALRKDQLIIEQEKKLRAKEIEVQNAAMSNPSDDLNGAIKGK
jgi:hypothetical protein